MNDVQFQETFLPSPEPNPRKQQRKGHRLVVSVIAVLVTLLVLGAIAGVLAWYFTEAANGERSAQRVEEASRIYSGHLALSNVRYSQQLEDPSSSDFQELAEKLEAIMNASCADAPELGRYFVKSRVFDFSDGPNLLAYYFARFQIPPEDQEQLPKFTDDALTGSLRQSVQRVGRSIGIRDISITTVTASLANPDLVMAPEERDCYYTLYVQDSDRTFTSPGYNKHGYPNNIHCQWVLRADRAHVIYLEFLDFNTDDDCGNDFVMVHDSLSPAEDDVITKKCGKRPSGKHLSVLSSGPVMLVTLLTDSNQRFRGFSANVSQRLRLEECGERMMQLTGTFSTPYYPTFYPPNIDCTWTIEVPSELMIRIRFETIRMEEPGLRHGECTKDYVEVDGERFCGDHFRLTRHIEKSQAIVRFHSDQSHTDRGFIAHYQGYNPSNPCPGQFLCRSGLCLSLALKCDGWNDCGDMSDEQHCSCEADQLACGNGLCKPKLWMCDRVNDCGDNTDEAMCECPSDHWKCQDGQCIPSGQVCDGHKDCPDSSDEAVCTNDVNICTDFNFKCANGMCVNKANAECDGHEDCEDGSDEDHCVPQCGERPYKQTRIVGGTSADLGEWPWQVSLHYLTSGHACGASLIAADWLVSAAHCFMDEYGEPSRWTVYGGLNFLTDALAQIRKVKRVLVHERYDPLTYDYDVAVLELERPFELVPKVHPICLPDSSHIFPIGKPCWVTGWGSTYEGGSSTVSLQKAEVKLINQTVCHSLLEETLTSRMLCSGYLAGGIDACQGDSGGPLSCREENGKWFLAGIVSWGEGCARRNKPGIYSRVTTLRKWIREKTSVWGGGERRADKLPAPQSPHPHASHILPPPPQLPHCQDNHPHPPPPSPTHTVPPPPTPTHTEPPPPTSTH